MSLRYAYNTNGTANHRLDDAVALIADAGYHGVALTLDWQHLDPLAPGAARDAQRLAARLDDLGLGSVIETGARFLLDPRAKHEPTFVSPEPEGRARRLAFLRAAIDVAAALGAEAVSFWAGVPRAGVDLRAARGWLRDGVAELLDHAHAREVTLALEPEPGMLVETVDDWRAFAAQAPGLTLALDTGHCLVTEEREPAAAVAEFAAQLGTVTVDDMRRGIHEHLPFGEGDMHLPAVLRALGDARVERMVCVELSRDSHRAHTMVARALEALRAAERAAALEPA
jgi:D-psicose/D-tagatose/L-ribulose 3-epimerase